MNKKTDDLIKEEQEREKKKWGHLEKPAFKREETFELAFGEELTSILQKYKEGSDHPLDEDEVDRLTEHLQNALNLIEGNITEKEYLKKVG